MTKGGLSLTFHYESQDALEHLLATLLRRCGWTCEKGGRWLQPGEVRRRYQHLSPAAFAMRLTRFRGEFPCKRSGSGRILSMKITPELDQHLRKKHDTNRQTSSQARAH